MRLLAIVVLVLLVTYALLYSLPKKNKNIRFYQKWDTVRDWFKLYKHIKLLPFDLQRKIFRDTIKGRYGNILGLEPGQDWPNVPNWALRTSPEPGFIRIRKPRELLNHVGKLVRVIVFNYLDVSAVVGRIVGQKDILMNDGVAEQLSSYVHIRNNARMVRVYSENSWLVPEVLMKWFFMTPYDVVPYGDPGYYESLPEDESNKLTELARSEARDTFISMDAPLLQSAPSDQGMKRPQPDVLLNVFPNLTVETSDYDNGIFLVEVLAG